MQAANWSKPNLAGIKSVKVDAKCTNAELLEAIKTVVSESVDTLRGTKADDKYRNIVNMLMLRVRGALAKTIEEISENSASVDYSQMTQDIVDSTKNSVNEKCSRIKAAFASQFQDKLACQYYITGRAGEPKRITLDRSLVRDKSGLILKR